ncbi:MAG: hypothetical protein KF774_16845 [Planctomyces sp.]|nr:hypothetical protein [Planctomyces sp.]
MNGRFPWAPHGRNVQFKAAGRMRGLVLAALLLSVNLVGPGTARGEDLETLRASVRERLSLLQTLKAELRAWTDIENSKLPEDVVPVPGICSIRWTIDQGKSSYDLSGEGYRHQKFYDGKDFWNIDSSIRDGKPANVKAYKKGEPPDPSLFQYAILPDLLGLQLSTLKTDLNHVLATPNARVANDYRPKYGHSDLAIRCEVAEPYRATVTVGFDRSRDWSPTLIEAIDEHAGVCVWFAEDWTTATSDITGEAVWIPSRGRYVVESPTSAMDIRFSAIAELDAIELPQSVPVATFVPAIAPGTQVWTEPARPGGLMQASIAGGAEGQAIRAAQLAEDAKRERDKLVSKGVLFDATPRPTPYGLYFVSFGLMLLLSVAGWRFLAARRGTSRP